MNHLTENRMGKAPAHQKVLIVGDSIVLGAAEVVDRKITRLVERCFVEDLREEFPDVEFVIEAEVHRTTEDVRGLIVPLLLTHEPDVVLVFAGGSDVDIQWRRFIISDGRIAKSLISQERYEANLRSIVERIENSGARVILTDIPNHYLALRGKYLSTLIGRDITPMIERNGGQEASDAGLKEYRKATLEIAADTGSELAEYAKVLSSYPGEDVTGFDGVHPNDLGHRLIAQTIIPVLAKVVRQNVSLPVMPDPNRRRATIPDAEFAQVWLDFDGTITQQDVLDELILRFSANESWKLIEERWRTGLIGSKECLSQEFALLRIARPQLLTFLDEVRVDPGLSPLLSLFNKFNVPVAIVSDGIDFFIERILEREGVFKIEVRSNQLSHRGEKLTLKCPHERDDCESGAAHCKCASIKTLGEEDRQSIYIGDGRSDLCPARKAQIVFAKGALAAALTAERIPFFEYNTLDDICATLTAAWSHQRALPLPVGSLTAS